MATRKFTAVLVLALTFSIASSAQEHKFKKFTKLALAHAALRAADATQTCIAKRNPKWHEQFLPWDSCSAIAVYSGATIPAEVLTRYALHSLGWHRVEPVNSVIWLSFPAAGIAYTSTH